jgi:bifunctional non-homologous end joining protein LigD
MANSGTKADFLGFIPPALATSQASPPLGATWVHELKLDGYRLQAHLRGGQVQLLTRRGLDWTARFGSIAPGLRPLPIKTAIIDGEVAVQDAAGMPRFAALQEALSVGRGPFVFYVFDLLYLDGRDLRALPLIERKARLAALIADADPVKYSDHFENGAALFQAACAIGGEGVVSKLRNAPYPTGRSKAWVKVKCTFRQEFVIAGYVRSNISAWAIGSLVLGYYRDGKLIYAGRVGTGFTEKNRRGSLSAARGDPDASEPVRQEASPRRGARRLLCPTRARCRGGISCLDHGSDCAPRLHSGASGR